MPLLFWFNFFLEARPEILEKISLVFLEDLKTPKRHFEIIWPLVNTRYLIDDLFKLLKLIVNPVVNASISTAIQAGCPVMGAIFCDWNLHSFARLDRKTKQCTKIRFRQNLVRWISDFFCERGVKVWPLTFRQEIPGSNLIAAPKSCNVYPLFGYSFARLDRKTKQRTKVCFWQNLVRWIETCLCCLGFLSMGRNDESTLFFNALFLILGTLRRP